MPYRCPQCRSTYSVAPELLGRRVRCSKCNHRFPAGAGEAPPPSPPPEATYTAYPAQGAGATAARAAAQRVAAPPPSQLRPPPPTAEYDALPARKKSGGRLLPILVIVILLGTLVGGVFFVMHSYTKPTQSAETTPPGELYAGIEIGSSGVKATVIEKFKDPELGEDFRVLFDETANTHLVDGLKGKDRKFDDLALKETAKAVQRYRTELHDKHKVPLDRIFIVASSGLLSPLEKKPDELKANRQKLAAALREAIDKTPDFLDAEREVELSIVGIIPRKFANESVLIDVGGGNTKGGYREPSGRFVTWSIPFGSRTFSKPVEDEAKRDKVSFADKVGKVRDDLVLPALHEQVKNKAGMTNRSRIYLSGGAVWAVTTLRRPADRKTFREIGADDFDEVSQRLSKSPDKLPLPTVASLDKDIQDKVRTELKEVGDAFPPMTLLAGTELVRACSTEFGLDKSDKKLYFASNGKIGWLLAYIVEESGK